MKVLFCRESLKFYKKLMCGVILVSFVSSLIVAPAGAQILPVISSPASLNSAFMPPVLLGLKVHPENPLLFDFIVDQGQSKLSSEELKKETEKLVKYFLAALTIPDKEVWVNLSPNEKDRIIPDVLGQTTMGKTMLEQDYVLKQMASSLTNPETDLGKKYWDQVNSAETSDAERSLTPNQLNKVWIMPAKAEVLESNGIVLVGEKRLKVMLAEDRSLDGQNATGVMASRTALSTPSDVAQRSSVAGAPSTAEKTPNDHPLTPSLVKEGEGGVQTTSVSTDIFRSTILPAIDKAVNESKDFADVRQIYNSVILAAWYKKALKESLLGKVYADKGKVAGVENNDQEMKQRIYEQYLAAFKKGAYNLIKEEVDADGDLIPRKYFSGGIESNTGEILERRRARPGEFTGKLSASSVIHDATIQLGEPGEPSVEASKLAVSASSDLGENYIASSGIKMTFVAIATALSLTANAVTPQFIQAYQAQQAFEGRTLSVKAAEQELNVNLDEMINTYMKNNSKIVPDALNSPNLQRALGQITKATTFDDVRKLTSKALQSEKDPVKKAALEDELGQWAYDLLFKSAVYDTAGANQILQSQKTGKAILSPIKLGDWRNLIVKLSDGRKFVCQNASEVFVMLMSDLRGVDDGAYSVVEVLKNFKGELQKSTGGHVAVLYNPSTGLPRFFDLAQTNMQTTVYKDQNGKVVDKKTTMLPIVHHQIVAKDKNGINYTIGVAFDMSNLKGFRGATATDLTFLIPARNELTRLFKMTKTLPSRVDSTSVLAMRTTMFGIIKGVVDLQAIVQANPIIGQDENIKVNLPNLVKSLSENLQNVELFIGSMVTAPNSSPENRNLISQAWSNYLSVKTENDKAHQLFQQRKFTDAVKQFAAVAQESQKQLEAILNSPVANIKPGDTTVALKIEKNGKTTEQYLGSGLIISELLTMNLNALNNVLVAHAMMVQQAVKTSQAYPYETRTVAAAVDNTQSASSAVQDFQKNVVAFENAVDGLRESRIEKVYKRFDAVWYSLRDGLSDISVAVMRDKVQKSFLFSNSSAEQQRQIMEYFDQLKYYVETTDESGLTNMKQMLNDGYAEFAQYYDVLASEPAAFRANAPLRLNANAQIAIVQRAAKILTPEQQAEFISRHANIWKYYKDNYGLEINRFEDLVNLTSALYLDYGAGEIWDALSKFTQEMIEDHISQMAAHNVNLAEIISSQFRTETSRARDNVNPEADAVFVELAKVKTDLESLSGQDKSYAQSVLRQALYEMYLRVWAQDGEFIEDIMKDTLDQNTIDAIKPNEKVTKEEMSNILVSLDLKNGVLGKTIKPLLETALKQLSASSALNQKLAEDLSPIELEAEWTAYIAEQIETFPEINKPGGIEIYQPLLNLFTPQVKYALLNDRSLRPVFMQILPNSSVGQMQIPQHNKDLVQQKIGDTTILELMQKYLSFRVGSTETALGVIANSNSGIKLVVAVTDRYYEKAKFRVANGRRVYFPLEDGTFLSLLGSGQNIGETYEEVPYYLRNEPGEPQLWVGLASELEVKAAELAGQFLQNDEHLFNQFLGYARINEVPDGDGNLVSIKDIRHPDGDLFNAAISFERVLSPQRWAKVDQIWANDHRFELSRRSISRTMANLGMIEQGSDLSVQELMLRVMKTRGLAEAKKLNKKLFKATINIQDLALLTGEESDNQEIRNLNDYLQLMDMGLTTEKDMDIVREYGISTAGIYVSLGLLRKFLQHSNYLERGKFFPTPEDGLREFFTSYFGAIESQNDLQVWATPVKINGNDRPLPLRNNHQLDGFLYTRILKWARQALDERFPEAVTGNVVADEMVSSSGVGVSRRDFLKTGLGLAAGLVGGVFSDSASARVVVSPGVTGQLQDILETVLPIVKGILTWNIKSNDPDVQVMVSKANEMFNGVMNVVEVSVVDDLNELIRRQSPDGYSSEMMQKGSARAMVTKINDQKYQIIFDKKTLAGGLAAMTTGIAHEIVGHLTIDETGLSPMEIERRVFKREILYLKAIVTDQSFRSKIPEAVIRELEDQIRGEERVLKFIENDINKSRQAVPQKSSSSSALTPVGGIDFDPTNMNLQIKRDGKGVPLPLPQQNLEQINIQGLFPIIINIVPINAQTLPIFLGQAPKEPAKEAELAASIAS